MGTRQRIFRRSSFLSRISSISKSWSISPPWRGATIEMVTKSIDAFVNRDVDLARKVISMDDVVDDLFDQVKAELIALIGKDASNGEQAMDLLMIAKYYERIGDHATNIAEWVEFAITGIHSKEGDQE